MLSFKDPEYLFLLIPVFLLIFLEFKFKVNSASILYPFANKPSFTHNYHSSAWKIIRYLLKITGVILIVLALARPQSSYTEVKRSTQGIDIMIAFDVSKSMLIEDKRNLSRINLAKTTTKSFVRGRSNDKIGFLMFSGESITLCPPTLDHEVVEKAIDAASTEQLKDGTAIGDAIASAVNRLKKSNSKSKVIVLLTDGDNNMGSITPVTAGQLAKGFNIKVYSIALGRDGMVALPQIDYSFGRKIRSYSMVNSSINPKLLKEISKQTGGKFFRAEDKAALESVYSEIDQLEKSKIETKEKTKWTDYFQIFLIIGTVMLILVYAVDILKLRVLPE